LTYQTDRQLGFFSDHDELYWNVTGNGWDFEMDSVTATVVLPTGAGPKNLTAYTGPQGARGHDYVATNLNGSAHFETTSRLYPQNGLSIVVEWPKGFVAEPTATARALALAKDNKGLLLGFWGLLLVLIYYFLAWARVGQDPARGVIIPLYAPPDGFSPAAVRYLTKMGLDKRGFAAAVLDLAVKGKLTIEEEKHFLQKKTYTLTTTDQQTADLPPEEKQLWQDLVGDGTALTLKQENYAEIQTAEKNLKTGLKSAENGLFATHWRWWLAGIILSMVAIGGSVLSDPQPEIAGTIFVSVGLTVWSVFVIALFRANLLAGLLFAGGELIWIALFIKLASFWMAGLIVLAVILNIIFYFLLKAYTPAGRRILDQIEGFKMYLRVAEKDRLNLENPPERTPELFEKFLPYALALGVEQKWSEQFADVLSTADHGAAYSPGWYQGSSWNNLGASGFAGSLGGSLTGAIASASVAPGSSGGGGGGGGGSGGGGGGGGGGGW